MNYKSKLMGLSLILLAAISACTDEMENGLRPANGNVVTFTVNTPGSDGNNTRADDDSAAVSKTYAPIKMQGSLDGKPLYLHTEVTEGIQSDAQPLTRGTQINNTNKDAAMQPFGVMAWVDALYDGAVYINQAEVTRDATSGKWFPTKDYLWPSNKKLAFLAWHPYGAAGLDVDKLVAKGQTSSYVVPTDVAQQVDLMFAKTDAMDAPVLAGTGSSSSIPLTFDHKLAAIKFVVGSDLPGCTITSIKLKNVITKAALTDELAWDLEALKGVDGSYPKADYTLTLNKEVSGTEGDPITAENETFFVIPQTPSNEVQIVVTLNDGFEVHEVTSESLPASTWKAGWTCIYKISASSITWTDTFLVENWPSESESPTYKGGSFNYKLTSYRIYDDNLSEKKALPWKAEFSEDGGNTWLAEAPTWLENFSLSGNGYIDATELSANVKEQTGEECNPHTEALRNIPAKQGSYNLANPSGGTANTNTANCYVVNAPGWYSFPLVYGNAIKDGRTNSAAYTSTASGDHIMKKFINHLGSSITDPYISNNAGCTPAKAELVWQDAQNLVTDIQYNAGDNGGTISFQVPQASICQGNAVIAIKDADDTVLWSWHIWVTDEDVSAMIPVSNFDNKTYYFMPVNLGWRDRNSIRHAERTCKVRFTAGDKTVIKNIKQQKAIYENEEYIGVQPYYVWGRKDPFRPADPTTGDEGTWYDKDGNAETKIHMREDFKTMDECIKNYILKPDVTYSEGWGDYYYYNLWSANCSALLDNGKVVKTIYDPSPVGYKVPERDAFTGFTTTGQEATSTEQLNGEFVASRYGFVFNTKNAEKSTIFFSNSGNFYQGSPWNMGWLGKYWSAIPFSTADGCMLYIDSSWNSVNPLDKGLRSSMCGAVRPVKDE